MVLSFVCFVQLNMIGSSWKTLGITEETFADFLSHTNDIKGTSLAQLSGPGVTLRKKRQCGSPERNTPWPFHGCPVNATGVLGDGFAISSLTSDLTCGLCDKQTGFASNLSQLSKAIENTFQKRCSDLIVYGVAFGRKYVNKLTKMPESRESYRQCLVFFVLDVHYKLLGLNFGGSRRTKSLCLLRTSNFHIETCGGTQSCSKCMAISCFRGQNTFCGRTQNSQNFSMVGTVK